MTPYEEWKLVYRQDERNRRVQAIVIMDIWEQLVQKCGPNPIDWDMAKVDPLKAFRDFGNIFKRGKPTVIVIDELRNYTPEDVSEWLKTN